jgi:hypothetical protein
MGCSACVTDTNFLWEDMDNYIRNREIFTWINEPQDSAKDLTNIVDIFEQFFDKDIIQEIASETSCYAQQLKYSRGSIFSKLSRQWVVIDDSRRNMYCTSTSKAYGYCKEAMTQIVFLLKAAGHTHFLVC